MILGNKTAIIQKKTPTGKNLIGESVESWVDVGTSRGWLDYQSGQNSIQQYNAKIQNTTHIWICDYSHWVKGVDSGSIRMVVDGDIYNALMIDNPMGLNQHMEVYLEYVGGGLGE